MQTCTEYLDEILENGYIKETDHQIALDTLRCLRAFMDLKEEPDIAHSDGRIMIAFDNGNEHLEFEIFKGDCEYWAHIRNK